MADSHHDMPLYPVRLNVTYARNDRDVFQAPTEEGRQWCQEHGVKVSSRFGVKEYHRTSWPRRTKCKEGNLAYFYDHWGYEQYDVVAQFDADHVPDPTYLSTCLPAFWDPQVGYVAAPSICSDNSEFWSTRGRLYQDAIFHGIGQAKFYPYWMPCCIGSHYTVRTSHLKEIGGIGPELDEDFSTSYMMTCKGYVGVFSLNTKAVGAGPACFEASMKQEYQWARSLLILVQRYVPKFFDFQMRLSEKYRTLQCCWYYINQTAYLIAVVVLITLPAFGFPFGEYTLATLLCHIALPFSICIGHAYWLRGQGWLRPAESPILTWELMLHALVAPLWNAKGVVDAVIGHVTGIVFTIKVTPKGDGGVLIIGWRSLLPMCTMSIFASVLVLVGWAQEQVPWVFGVLYFIAAFVVPALHYWENHRGLIPWQNLLALSIPLLLTTAVFTLSMVFKGGTVFRLLSNAFEWYVDELPWNDTLVIIIGAVAVFAYCIFLGLVGYITHKDSAKPPYSHFANAALVQQHIEDKQKQATKAFLTTTGTFSEAGNEMELATSYHHVGQEASTSASSNNA